MEDKSMVIETEKTPTKQIDEEERCQRICFYGNSMNVGWGFGNQLG